MPKRPKKSPFGPDRLAAFEAVLAVKDDAIPHTPELLRDIVHALLSRIEGMDADLAKQLRSVLLDMAAREWNIEHRGQDKPEEALVTAGKALSERLLDLAYARKLRGSHWWDHVAWQRDAIHEYLKAEPIPSKGLPGNAVLAWLDRHGDELAAALAVVHCGCRYQPNFRTIARDDVEATRGNPAELALLLLAHWHEMTSTENIRKQLARHGF